ncbi:MAG: flavin reductase family protein [Clostridiales bacterium]|nr:flavin reductase family protein [Clostridiales bacterium]
MQTFREIDPFALDLRLFHLIRDEWMLVTAAREGRANPMTASWGGLGMIWGKPAAFIFVRESRYTHDFLDASEGFSLTFFEERYRPQLELCGERSGRELDKVEACGFTVQSALGIPYFAESNLVMLCRKMARQRIEPEGLYLPEVMAEFYADGPGGGPDYHDLYIGEIQKVLSR